MLIMGLYDAYSIGYFLLYSSFTIPILLLLNSSNDYNDDGNDNISEISDPNEINWKAFLKSLKTNALSSDEEYLSSDSDNYNGADSDSDDFCMIPFD